MDTDAFLAACRLLHDLSAMLLWGASVYLWALVPTNLARDVERRLQRARVVAIAMVVATTAVALPIETASIGAGWRDALDPAAIGAVLADTSVGHAWQAQAVAAVLLVAVLALPERGRRAGVALASGLVVAGITLTGHAVMHEGWEGVLHRLNDAVHVLCAGAWLGRCCRCSSSCGR